MPPKKSRGRKSKAAAAPKEATPPATIETNITEVAAQVVEAVSDKMEGVVETVAQVAEAATEFVEVMNGDERPSGSNENSGEDTSAAPTTGTSTPSLTPEERKQKLEELRSRMRESTQANRAAAIREATTHKLTIKEQTRLEKQKHLAEILRSKAQAEEDGREDEFERKKNWEYSIEENDAWEKRLKRKKGRADFDFRDDEEQARRKYKKDLDLLKPDLVAYNRQKEVALGLVPGTLVKTTDAGKQVVSTVTSEEQRLAAESLYRDANSLLYADNKPSEEAIDRMVAKLNKDVDKRNKFSRKRTNDDDTELITYINEKNRVFNKKIARYYDKYTEEIRASFERGTAL